MVNGIYHQASYEVVGGHIEYPMSPAGWISTSMSKLTKLVGVCNQTVILHFSNDVRKIEELV